MKKLPFTIRPAEFKDTEAIFNLMKMYPEELLPRPISDIAENIDRFLVYETKDGIIGTVSWQILPEIGAPRHPSVEIKSLAVKDNYRNSGIGSALIRKAIQKIKLLQPAHIIALTFTPVFFRKLGFKKASKAKLMHKLYTGCINCTKYDSPFTCPETAMILEL